MPALTAGGLPVGEAPPMSRDLPPGIRVTPHGFQAYVKVAGRMRSRRFPPDEPIANMTAWRKERQARAVLSIPEPRSTFEQDARTYLGTVPTMPTIRERRMQLAWWTTHFRGRDRTTITAQEIRRALEVLRAAGKAASTCNHYRSALSHLWTVLDGRSAFNPVRDVPKFDEGDPEPRALPTDLVEAIFETIRPGKTHARLSVIRWTGLPHAQLRQIEPEDVNWMTRELYVRRRKKGRGAAARVLPLLPQAVAALRAMKRYEAWGSFSMRSMRVTLRRALEKIRADVAARRRRLSPLAKAWLARDTRFTRVRPYDLRHTHGVLLAVHVPDAKIRQHLMLHADPRQTARYELAAADPMARRALRAVSAALGAKVGREVAGRLPVGRKSLGQAANGR